MLAATALAPRARGEGAPAIAGATDQAATLADRARLQVQLDRVNAEIDALKRRPLGIRDDYRLRSRMADAEALARRLNEIDARLGPAARPAGPDVAPPEIHVSPSDDRAEREAKADILADQARRLSQEAGLLEGRLATLRVRSELKRRSGQLERDPFAPLEQAKSRVGVNGTGPGPASDGTGTKVSTPSSDPPRSGTTTTDTHGASPSAGSPTGGGATPTAILPQPAGAAPISQSADGATGSLAGQLRGVLDPTSLEEVRRLETPGAGAANVKVMERALATMRARAAQLSAASAALRAPKQGP